MKTIFSSLRFLIPAYMGGGRGGGHLIIECFVGQYWLLIRKNHFDFLGTTRPLQITFPTFLPVLWLLGALVFFTFRSLLAFNDNFFFLHFTWSISKTDLFPQSDLLQARPLVYIQVTPMVRLISSLHYRFFEIATMAQNLPQLLAILEDKHSLICQHLIK